MAYQKIPFTPDYGGVTADDMNHIQTQYDEAAADLNAHKSANPIDHPNGSVTLAKLASSAMTSPGGTEANRLARTNSSGRVGDSERLGGQPPTAYTPPHIEAKRARAPSGTSHSPASVTWTRAFNNVPIVVATVESDHGISGEQSFCVVVSRSRTGATIHGWRLDSGSLTSSQYYNVIATEGT